MAIELERLYTGKLPPDLLHELIERYTHKSPEIRIGGQVGEDATVIEQGEGYLIVKTDPITFVSDRIGFYAVHINANDIYCMGGRPRWFLCTVLLPEKQSSRKQVHEIFSQVSQACQELDVVYCGGHTEVTIGLTRPILVGQMLGTATRDELLDKRTIQVGDHLLLVREVPLEGTAIIAACRAKEVRKLYSADLLQKCRSLLTEPGLSVGPAARLLRESGQVHALHDPTEGGLATALRELTRPGGLCTDIVFEEIPILPEGKLLCDQFGLDPLGTIASGSLLAAVPAKSVKPMLAACEAQNMTAADIGHVCRSDHGHVLRCDGIASPLPHFVRDEIIKLFE